MQPEAKPSEEWEKNLMQSAAEVWKPIDRLALSGWVEVDDADDLSSNFWDECCLISGQR